MNRFGFLMGFIIVIVFFKWSMTSSTESVLRPAALQQIQCNQPNTKDALAHFSSVAIYQLCLTPTNIEHGVKNLNIEIYFTKPHVDCRNQAAGMCEYFSTVSMMEDAQHKVYLGDGNATSANGFFSFKNIASVPNEENFDERTQFKLESDAISWPSGMRPLTPVICDSYALRSRGNQSEAICWSIIEKFGVFFLAQYSTVKQKETPTDHEEALSAYNRWLNVMDGFIVKNEESI